MSLVLIESFTLPEGKSLEQKLNFEHPHQPITAIIGGLYHAFYL